MLTGDSAETLREVATADWADLETRIVVADVDQKVRVVAYDRNGQKLMESALVDVGVRSTG